MPVAQGWQCLAAVLSATEAPHEACAVMQATENLRPSTSLLLFGLTPNRGVDVVHGVTKISMGKKWL